MGDQEQTKDAAPVSASPKGGVSGKHPPIEHLPIVVAPATGKGKNTIRMELIPIACWRINDIRFDFGSSFVLPDSKTEFEDLAPPDRTKDGASPLSNIC